uniref:Uncharacterized protein n=1 Tax=Romanomermis culicivorax TaxID=13658 RepID=A0A915JLM4_ROMCU
MNFGTEAEKKIKESIREDCDKTFIANEYNHQENVEKIGTAEEELEKGREACNKDFIEIKANPSIITMQKIYHDYKPEVVSKKYAKLFKNYNRFCKEVYGSTEPAPEEKHLQSIKDSIKMISL